MLLRRLLWTLASPQQRKTAAVANDSGFLQLNSDMATWLGVGQVYLSPSVRSFQFIAVASSRLSRRTTLFVQWAEQLQSLLQCLPQNSAILIHQACAGHRLLQRACERYGIPTVEIVLFSQLHALTAESRDAPPGDWQESCQSLAVRWSSASIPGAGCTGFLAVPQESTTSGLHTDLRDVPLHDRVLFAMADRIHLLRVRSGGNIQRLVRCSQRSSFAGTKSITISDSAAKPCSTAKGSAAAEARFHRSNAPSLPADGPLQDPERWLVHWTREFRGPWPGESETQYHDAVLLSTAVDHSACGTLQRILREELLRASTQAIRGGHAVVSFTAVPLREFRDRHVYRKHRRRYDFEPWGLALRKSVLLRFGAAPVCYSDARSWSDFPAEQRPWFQRRVCSAALDTEAEQEWRICGDLSLVSFSSEDLVVFVDNSSAAVALRQWCRFPVLVLPNKRTP